MIRHRYRSGLDTGPRTSYSKRVEKNTFMDANHAYGSFSIEDWGRILNSLNHFINDEERRLAHTNCGDGPWTELSCYETLKRDIELYVVGKNL